MHEDVTELFYKEIAHHEAGHVIMAHILGIHIDNVTMGSWHGNRRVAAAIPVRCFVPPDQRGEYEIRFAMGGLVAARLYCEKQEAVSVPDGYADSGAKEDRKKIARIAERDGISESCLSEFWEQTRQYLSRPAVWNKVEAIANALLQKGKLSEDEIWEAVITGEDKSIGQMKERTQAKTTERKTMGKRKPKQS